MSIFRMNSLEEELGLKIEDYEKRLEKLKICLQYFLEHHLSGNSCNNCFKKVEFWYGVFYRAKGCICFETHPTHEVGKLGSGETQSGQPGWLKDICDICNRINHCEIMINKFCTNSEAVGRNFTSCLKELIDVNEAI